jgi:membrane protease YdiL (CAAX protease family)
VALVSSLRPAALHHWFEALAATAAFLAAAFGLQALLEPLVGDEPSFLVELVTEVGLGWALFTVALCPGVFEELAFRGQVLARLTDLFGMRQGQLMTAAAFALAHGVTPALPLHFGIGLYLGHVRSRSGSLLPGMLLHVLYNGTLVLAEA